MPDLVRQYNLYMGGVDRMDENLQFYGIGVGGKKWWWNCFAWCIDTAVHNAWQLYRKQAEEEAVAHLDQLSFRRYIAKSYLQGHGTLPEKPGKKVAKATNPHVTDEVRYDGNNHWIEEATGKPACAECGGRTCEKCSKCNVGLHVKCFKAFHTN